MKPDCETTVTTTEQIDRIERDVENIHANLDKGDRLMRYT
jgi:hypothetical protein